jgi:S1-C subfamily serine protease
MKRIGTLLAAAALGTGVLVSQVAGFQFTLRAVWFDLAIQTTKSTSNSPIANQNHQLAPAGAPVPNEPLVQLPSWAPLVKRVMPTVVKVAITEEVNQ